MPADCAAPIAPATLADEPFLIGEPHAPRPPVAAPSAGPGSWSGAVEEGESREAFARRKEEKYRKQDVGVAAPTTDPALAAAIAAVYPLADAYILAQVDHAVCEEFGGSKEELALKENTWIAAGDAWAEALNAVLDVHPSSISVALEKVRAYYALQGGEIGEAGEMDTSRFATDTAFATLWHDLFALSDDAASCPAARLMDRHEPVQAAMQAECDAPFVPGGADPGPATLLNDKYEEAATWVRAQSLRGAAYQLALAVCKNSVIQDAGNCDDVAEYALRAQDHKAIGRMLVSALSVVLKQSGSLPHSDIIEANAGYSLRTVTEELSDDPPLLDTYTLIRDYREAGGRFYITERDGVATFGVLLKPRIPETTALLVELQDPVVCLAVEQYLLAEQEAEQFKCVVKGLRG